MYRSIWNNFHKSVCALNFYSCKGIQFYRSSGFRYEDYIIGGYCADQIRKACFVIIDYNTDNSEKSTESVRIPISEFRNSFYGNPSLNLPGIMILHMKFNEFKHVPPVKSFTQPVPEIGTQVAILSCSRLINQIHIKKGLISSIININGHKLILIDSCFDPGNCGAPLFDALTGKLAGVIVDCFPSPAGKHKKLKKIIDENIRMLNDATGKWTIGNIDPVQVLMANQYMIKNLAKEIYLSCPKSYCICIPIESISRHIRNLNHKEEFKVCEEAVVE